MLMDLSTMTWLAIGYIIHLVFVVIQCGLAGYLIVSGILNIVGKNQESRLLKRLGLTASTPDDKKVLFGSIKTGLGVLLLPILVNAPYIVSGLASITALVLFIYLETTLSTDSRRPGFLVRYVVIMMALLNTGMIFFNQTDNVTLGTNLLF